MIDGFDITSIFMPVYYNPPFKIKFSKKALLKRLWREVNEANNRSKYNIDDNQDYKLEAK